MGASLCEPMLQPRDHGVHALSSIPCPCTVLVNGEVARLRQYYNDFSYNYNIITLLMVDIIYLF